MMARRTRFHTEVALRRTCGTMGTMILLNDFKRQWEMAAQAAGIEGLHFHDLRGTAVTMLSEAGGTPQQIATITGHSLKSVAAILDNFTPFHDNNSVGIAHRAQPMGNDKARPPRHQPLQRLLHQRLALAVERRRRFVQNQERRGAEQPERDHRRRNRL